MLNKPLSESESESVIFLALLPLHIYHTLQRQDPTNAFLTHLEQIVSTP